MARKKKKVIETIETIEEVPQVVLGAAEQSKFSVEHKLLNKVDEFMFPGNVAPEGYFYAPFHEVVLKELEDEIDYITVRRINFVPASASSEEIEVTAYDPLTGGETVKNVSVIKIDSPVPYSVILHQPFSIYDAMDEKTYRGYLSGASGTELTIETEASIDENGLNGGEANGKSRYIISLLEENAPEYAEFIPSSQRLVWRAPKKMSELESTSPLYNMPFTNGRNYIHKNVNMFVRRQDPQGEFYLYRPSQKNPLRRFQVEGNGKIDFDTVRYITDTLIHA